MSRIGKQPVVISSGVTVEINKSTVTIKGPKGELKREIHPNIKIEIQDNKIIASRLNEEKATRALHGLMRNLLVNMVEGVTKGFEKRLEIIGVGFRAQTNKNKINLTLGFSHPIEFIADKGIEFEMDKDNKNLIIIRGMDKQVVGEVAAKVRSFKKPEPYKGKGIKYIDEQIQRKAGKAGISAGGGK